MAIKISVSLPIPRWGHKVLRFEGNWQPLVAEMVQAVEMGDKLQILLTDEEYFRLKKVSEISWIEFCKAIGAPSGLGVHLTLWGGRCDPEIVAKSVEWGLFDEGDNPRITVHGDTAWIHALALP